MPSSSPATARRISPFLLVLLAGLTAGCDRKQEAAPSTAPAAEAAAPAPAEASYSMSVENWEGPKGEEGYVVVTIDAKNGHKINADYPHKVSLDTPPAGLKLPLPTMTAKDAERDGDKRLVFSIPMVADEVGEYVLNGTVRLSVCSPDTCRIEKEPLAARIVAQ